MRALLSTAEEPPMRLPLPLHPQLSSSPSWMPPPKPKQIPSPAVRWAARPPLRRGRRVACPQRSMGLVTGQGRRRWAGGLRERGAPCSRAAPRVWAAGG
jgi:hypothetical protein